LLIKFIPLNLILILYKAFLYHIWWRPLHFKRIKIYW